MILSNPPESRLSKHLLQAILQAEGIDFPEVEHIIEVRDSRTGYLVPGRDGLGVWPDGKIVGTSSPPPSASSGNSGQETIFGVFELDFDSYERYQDFETGVLHRISSRIYLA